MYACGPRPPRRSGVMDQLSGEKYLFSGFELDPAGRVLKKDGEQVTITSKAVEVLIELVRNHGDVVTKDQLFDNVWPGQFVEENNLTVQISGLRKALGERKGDRDFIATVSGRGYKFVGTVEVLAPTCGSLHTRGSPNRGELGASDLIGRDRELGELDVMLNSGKARLITLTGAGGCGKTRLAAAVHESFGGRAFFVELAELRDPGMLIASIAEKLKVPQASVSSPIEQLAAFISSEPTLLVLDNFEQIITGANEVKELLDRSAGLTIIVTSRAPLRLKIETEYKVGPLALPSVGDLERDEPPSAALTLFLLRAQAARQSFNLTPENAREIAEICTRVDGLPLAIELAAARIKVLSPASILERLQRSLDLLTGGGLEVPDRQRTIKNTLAWSYELLTDDERALFRGLAVFAGGFTVDTAEAIFGDQLETSASTLDLLTSLTDWGLLNVREEPNGNTRLSMLEVVREFAAELLAGSGEMVDLRGAHAAYFLALVENAEPHLVSADSAAWTTMLRSEIDNIRSSIAFFLDHDGLAAARLAAAARYFWINRSQLADGCYWLSRALDVSGDASAEVRFKLIAGLGSFYRLRGDYELSRHYYEMALAENSVNGNESHVALATAGLGTVSRLEGEIDDARLHFEKALDISRRIGDKRSISIALNCLADVLVYEENRSGARTCLEEAMSIYRDLGQSEAECNNLNILGKLMLEDDRDGDAYEYYSRALSIARSLDNKINTLEALIGFSAIAFKAGNDELATMFSGAAERLRESIDYKLEPAEEKFHRTYLEQARKRLDESSFSAAANNGRTLALTRILDLTGSKLDDLAPCRQSSREITIERRTSSTIIIDED